MTARLDYRLDTKPEIKDLLNGIGSAIGGALPPGKGFALMIFDMGPGSEDGEMAWISSADRQDMVKALAEMIWKLNG